MATTPKGNPLPFRPPTDDAQLVPWLEAKRKIGKPVINEANLKLQLAYVLGYQWLNWDSRARAYRRPAANVSDPNAPVRLKSNKIGPAAERLIAKLTKSVPDAEARPISDDDNDVDAAKVGTRILSSEQMRLKWPAFLQKFLFWPVTHGWAYAHVYWDPDDGDEVATDEEGSLFLGNSKIEEVAADELSVDPSAMSMDVARWCIRTTIMTREEAWNRWDVTLEGGAHRTLAQEVHSLGAMDQAAPNEEWVEIHQLWMLPGKAAPQGLVVTWSESTVIEKKPFPYNHGKLPFVQCNWLPGIGTREGRTWVSDALDLQADYNDALSREATFRRQLSPKFVAAVGQVDPNRITSRVETLLYMPGITASPPHLEMPNAAWAQQFEMGMNRDAADIGERAGVGDASSGQSASSAPAAAILALQEADDTKLALTATELATFIGEVGWQLLMLARQYWSEERTVRVWSTEDTLSAYRYLGSDIDEQLDIHVSSESALPKSKAARAQLMMELAARYPDLVQPQDLIRMLDVPGVDFLTRSIDIDTKKQWREIGQLLEGDDCQVQPFDNHVIHLSVMNQFRKSVDYEQLDDAGRAIFDAHAAVHEMLVLKQMGMSVPTPNPTYDPNAAAQSQMAGAGPAGPGPGGPPQPGGGAPSPGYLLNPMTGTPPDPLAVASGQAPDMLAQTSIAKRAGIGQAAGQPGRVPGIPVDNQAHSMGH